MQRRLLWVTLFSVAIVFTVLYHARKVHAKSVHDNHPGCSVASLKGTYAIRRTGNVMGGPTGPIAEIAIAFYSGDGTRGLIRATRSTNGEIRPWTNYPANGSYTVDPDCTGSLFDEDGTQSNNLVVFDGG